jgi:hypothetical protein
MGDVVSRRTLTINYSGGNFALKRVESFDFNDDSTLEVAVSTAGPIGFQDSDQGGSFTLNVFPETDTPEVHYHRLKESKERFTLTEADYPTGIRLQHRNCRIEKVSQKTGNDGKPMIEVTGKYLSQRVLN